jgi:hypothetical protein
MPDKPRTATGETAQQGGNQDDDTKTGMGRTPKPEESTGQQGAGNLQQRVEQLEAALANARAGMPLNLTPLHGAGYEEEVEETWSLYDQEQARLEA